MWLYFYEDSPATQRNLRWVSLPPIQQVRRDGVDASKCTLEKLIAKSEYDDHSVQLRLNVRRWEYVPKFVVENICFLWIAVVVISNVTTRKKNMKIFVQVFP
jgi:hypothetical protein